MRDRTQSMANEFFVDMVSDGLVTVSEASKFLGISKSKLYQLMDQGQLHWTKLGSSRRIPKKALINLASNNMQGGWALPSA